MRKTLQIVSIVYLLTIQHFTFGQQNINLSAVIQNLTSPEWSKVYKAKDTLEMNAANAIPYLLKLLNDPNKYVKLTNTADLIYPGTEIFYGHGWVIDYDIDFIAIRAGWVIEKLTFQDFGFKENIITDAKLIEYHKAHYSEYQKTGFHNIKLEGSKKNNLEETTQKVKTWWSLHKTDWNRRQAIIDA